MPPRLQTTVYDVTPDPGKEAVFGSPSIAAGIERQELLGGPVVLTRQAARRYRYRLRRATTGRYTTATPVVVQHSPRGGNLVRAWQAIELLWSAPTDTTVETRLHDGTDSYYWTGAAWAVAGAGDWNTPAVVTANFAAFSTAVATELAPEWRLTTTDNRFTPLVYGAHIAAGLQFGARSSLTAASFAPSDTGSDSWDDDVIHRVLIPLLREAAPEVTDELTTSALTSTIDYSDGIGEANYDVNGVLAAYDLDADPTMTTPLAGSFDTGTQIWTFTAAVASGTRIALRLTYQPQVAFTADRHYVSATFPHIVVEVVREVRSRAGSGDVLVRDTVAETALSVAAPHAKIWDLQILLQSEHARGVLELREAVQRAFGGQHGALRVSANTGAVVHAFGLTPLRPARRGIPMGAAARFDLRLRSRQYLGVSTTVNLVTATDGVVVTVGYDTDVATPAGS